MSIKYIDINNLELPLGCYKIFEYIGVYDIMEVDKRKKYLEIGLLLYKNKGLDLADFEEFHVTKNKLLPFIITLFLIFVVFLGVQTAIKYPQLKWSFLGFFAVVVFLQTQLQGRKIRSNRLRFKDFIHTKKKIQDQFFEINSPIAKATEEVVNPKKDFEVLTLKTVITEEDLWTPDHNSLKNDIEVHIPSLERLEVSSTPYNLSFQENLIAISKQPNLFDGINMNEVINHFMVMCRDDFQKAIPQMTQKDFISFLRAAFLGDELVEKIILPGLQIGRTITVFHQYYKLAKIRVSKPSKIKYVKLLSDHILGIDEKAVIDNFRS